MDQRVILAKIITLIYRESLVSGINKSTELIRNILNIIKVDGNEVITLNGHNKVKDLKSAVLELLESNEPIEKDMLLQKLRLIVDNDEKLYKALEQGIVPDYDEASNKRVIVSIVKYLNNFYKEHAITELINNASMKLKFDRDSIGNLNEYVSNLIAQLEPLQISNTLKDPALINDIDIGDQNGLTEAFDQMKSNISGNIVFKTGWQALNRMTQGGFRRGEFVTIGALQHKYKTGFTLSLFAQIARHNTPVMIDSSKKPLLLRISFEDDIIYNLQFLYQYLKANDGEPVTEESIKEISAQELSIYIRDKLSVNGFHIKMLRVDPTMWSYRDICNKAIELEAKGYEIHLCMLDYLSLVPTTGCVIGPMGTDRRDQFRRIRNFFQARKTTVITPHQLSTEAKQLIRNGVPEHQLVKEVAEKGYYEGSKQLDQEIDLELYIHLFSHMKKTYLSVQRGKHRLPTVIDDEDKYFILPFPGKNIPILEDINGKDMSMITLPKKVESSTLNELIF